MASGAYTHTRIHTHTYFGEMKVIIRNQAHTGLRPVRAWFKKFVHTICIRRYHRRRKGGQGAIAPQLFANDALSSLELSTFTVNQL